MGVGTWLAIDAVDQLHEPISRLCETLESIVGIPVQAEIYACCGEGAPRSPQWDDHETLLMQIEGRKSWDLFQTTVDYPVGGRELPEPSGDPRWNGILSPGDLLYIPRGWWYLDHALDEPSLYLVITFKNPRGIDILARVLEKAVEKDLMRMDIPRFKSAEIQSSFLTFAQQEITHLVNKPGLFLSLLSDIQESSDPRVEFQLPWSAEADPLPPSEDYVLAPLLRFPSLKAIERRRDVDYVKVMHNGRPVKLELEVADVLAQLCGSTVFTVGCLVATCSDKIPSSRILRHVSELIKLGLATARKPEDDNVSGRAPAVSG